MASYASLGVPLFVDYAADTSAAPFRNYEIGTRVSNAGTATANQVAGGVFPGAGAMAVTPGSGLAVTVAAGYCCVPAASAAQGGYVFGAMTAQSLTLTASDPVNPRIDLVIARVYDLGSPASYCDVEVITGTAAASPAAPSLPSVAITLAQVEVLAGAASVTSGNITDERSWVIAPGGILPIQSAASAPAVPAWQLMYNVATGTIVSGTGVAGSVSALPVLPWAPVMSVVSSPVNDSSAKGTLTTVATASCTTDGSTDIEVYYKWPGFTVSTAPLLVTVQVALDGTAVDQTVLYPGSASVASSGGSARWYSAGASTPAAGTHTVTFAFQSASASATTTLSASAAALAALRITPVST